MSASCDRSWVVCCHFCNVPSIFFLLERHGISSAVDGTDIGSSLRVEVDEKDDDDDDAAATGGHDKDGVFVVYRCLSR